MTESTKNAVLPEKYSVFYRQNAPGGNLTELRRNQNRRFRQLPAKIPSDGILAESNALIPEENGVFCQKRLIPSFRLRV